MSMSPTASPNNMNDNAFLSVAQAQQFIREQLVEISDFDEVPLRLALGRVLANDILSPINVPAHDNSAMDGFAFNSAQLIPGQTLSLSIIGEALAGHPYSVTVPDGNCVRIMTGAVMPASCDTVVPQELVTATQSAITIPANTIAAGDNRRLCGEDLEQGKTAIAKGKRISPAELGLIASLGINTVTVKRKPKIAYFSTGDEIRSLGEKLDEGCIYDSNRYTVYGMLSRLDCDIIDMGVIEDHPEALEIALREACGQADAIITSGGVSVGAADYTKQVMAKLGQVAFWTIGMRPGRPMTFGQIQSHGKSAYLFGLPGNPVAVMVTFYFFVKQALQQLNGERANEVMLIPASARHPIRKRRGRTEYQRGIVSRNAKGMLEVEVTGSQGSGVLRSMSEANCMIVLNDERDNIATGDLVEILLFDGLV